MHRLWNLSKQLPKVQRQLHKHQLEILNNIAPTFYKNSYSLCL